MGPLSGKQHREYLKFQNKEAREAAKMELDESRKQQLHEIKLQEAAAKANQGLGHKEQVNNAKLKDMGIPAPKMNKQKLGIPTQNPLAGTGMFKQGQRDLPKPLFQAQGTDTVPAMLTPGEAVIPAPAAQNPKNKKAIQRMVQEGRKANKLRDGAVDVRYSGAPGQAKYHSQGTMSVPSLAYEHPDVPGSSFSEGTEHVFSRGSADMQHYNNGSYGVVPQQVQSAAGYEDGTDNVSYLDRFLNFVGGQQVPVQQPVEVVAPLANSTPSEVSKEDFFKMRAFAEASNDPRAKQRQAGQTASSLTGTTAGTLPLYQKINPKLQGVAHNSEAYFKPEYQRELSDTQYDDYAKQLKKKGLPITVENLYAAGFGPRGVSAIAAKDDEPLDKHFTKNELKQNTYFGKTAGDFKNFIAQKATKAGKSLAQVATDMIPSAQAGTLPVPEVAVVPNDTPRENQNLNARYPALKPVPGFNRMGQMNAIVPTPRSTTSTVEEPSAVNVDPMGNVISVTQDQVIDVPKPKVNSYPVNVDPMGNVIAGNENLLESDVAAVPPTTNKEIPSQPDMSKNQQAFANDREYNMALSQYAQQVAPQVEAAKVEAQKIPDPEAQKSFLERAVASLFGKSGLFGDQELIRFSLLAAGGMLTGGSVGGSLKFAGLNTLQAADKRQATEAAARAENLKNTRELRERLDSDYRTALGENVSPAIRAQAIKLYSQADTEAKQRAVIQLLKSNKNVEEKDGPKPGNPDQGFFDGKPIVYRNFKGNIQTVDPETGEWSDIKPTELKRFETVERYRSNLQDMKNSTVNRLTPVLRNAFGKQKNYNAEDEAKGYTEALLLLKEDLGPNISSTSFGKMSENAIKAAVDSALSSGKTTLTEEGLRKAFFGNAVIETRMTTNSRDLYVNKGDKGKIELPSAEYQTALGNALNVYKKEGIPLSQASEQIENRWNSLSPADKKKFTDMSKGAPGSTPMLYWLRTTGGNI